MELEFLKKKYTDLAKKYSLPTFKALNDEFEIDKIDKETDNLLRLIRKVMMEKIVHSLTFLEMLLNPVNVPRIYLLFIKSLNSEDKTIIDKIYEKFGELSIQSLHLEIDSSDQKEAEMIKRIFNTWKEMKPYFLNLLMNKKKPTIVQKKEKSYFG